MAELVTRPVTLADVDLITDHRVRMFADNGHPQAVLDAMTEPFRTIGFNVVSAVERRKAGAEM